MTPKRDWLPTMWSDWGEDAQSPFYALRKQLDTLLDDYDRSDLVKGGLQVRTNLSETDTEIRITAELPGIERDEFDVEVTGDAITIQGEKTSEKDETGEEAGRQFRRLERRAGSFRRVTHLPFKIAAETVTANIRNGVLTVTVPKPAQMKAPGYKVDVKSAA